jgi:hypothetical protein
MLEFVNRKCRYEVEIADVRELQEQTKFCWEGSGEEMTGSVMQRVGLGREPCESVVRTHEAQTKQISLHPRKLN